MFKRYTVLVSIFVGLVLAACSQLPSADAPQEPEVALEAAATSLYTTYEWRPGYGKRPLLRTSEGFCWLAGVEGKFASPYDSAWVRHEGGRWYLEGNENQTRVVWAGAECVKWSAVKTPNVAQPARMLSDNYFVIARECVQETKETWWGDAATMLTGIAGNLRNSGVTITQGTDGFKPSRLSARHCSGAIGWPRFTQGQAHSVFVGQPGTGNLPEFWAPGNKSVSYAHTFYADTATSTSKTLELAPADQAFCYLTGIGDAQFSNGAFSGAGDWVWLHRGNNGAGKEVWKLNVNQTKEAANFGFISVRAACYRLTQY